MGLFAAVRSRKWGGGVGAWVLGVEKGNILGYLVDEGQCVSFSVSF